MLNSFIGLLQAIVWDRMVDVIIIQKKSIPHLVHVRSPATKTSETNPTQNFLEGRSKKESMRRVGCSLSPLRSQVLIRSCSRC